MRALLKLVVVLVVLAVLAAGGWWWSGRSGGPRIEIRQPTKVIGLATPMEVAIDSPGGELSAAAVSIEQNGKSTGVFELTPASAPAVKHETADHVVISGQVGKREQPVLEAGAARL